MCSEKNVKDLMLYLLCLLLKMPSQQNVKDLMLYLFSLLGWIKATFARLFPCGGNSKILTQQYNEISKVGLSLSSKCQKYVLPSQVLTSIYKAVKIACSKAHRLAKDISFFFLSEKKFLCFEQLEMWSD